MKLEFIEPLSGKLLGSTTAVVEFLPEFSFQSPIIGFGLHPEVMIFHAFSMVSAFSFQKIILRATKFKQDRILKLKKDLPEEKILEWKEAALFSLYIYSFYYPSHQIPAFMLVEETPLQDCLILTPTIHKDGRGFFYEQFNQRDFDQLTQKEFIPKQDNTSFSRYGVIRGFHAQQGEFSQAKIVSVMQGKVLDVVVDLRPESPSFKKSFSLILSSDNHQQLYIPRGFLHGFSTLSKTALFFYKCDNFFNGPSGFGVRYDDPDLQIDWKIPAGREILSEKDAKLPYLKDLNL